MNFEAFVVVSVAGLVAAAIVHYLVGYRILDGFDGFLGKVMAGWLGAWLGSPIIGHWVYAGQNRRYLPDSGVARCICRCVRHHCDSERAWKGFGSEGELRRRGFGDAQEHHRVERTVDDTLRWARGRRDTRFQ